MFYCSAKATGESAKPSERVRTAVSVREDEYAIIDEKVHWRDEHVTTWAKSALNVIACFDDDDKFKNAVIACKRQNNLFQSRIACLEAVTTARYRFQEEDTNAKLAKLERETEEYKQQESKHRGELPDAREQKLRNLAYDLCAHEIVKTDSRPNLNTKIADVKKQASQKREHADIVDDRVQKRVKKMSDLAAQFEKLKEHILTDSS